MKFAWLTSLVLLTAPPLLKGEEKGMSAAVPVSPAGLDFVVNLREPVFTHGVISTEHGGVITAEGIRIQAQKIEYTNRIENGLQVQRIVAEGDLMMEYADRAFVGTRLEYDFVTRSGTLWEGKTFVDIWYLGGDRIEMHSDGSYYVYNAFITTCESQDNTWEIKTGQIKISNTNLLTAKNIRFNFFKIPVFWVPSFKSNLKFVKDPPIRYKVKWDKGLGPRLSMRYRVYSWEHLNVFLRFDYRLKLGPGGALESSYYSEDGRTVFLSKNYGAWDKSVPDERGPRRFRLQGLYQTQSIDDKTRVHLSYDRLSDDKMPGDFKNDDFEVNTQKRTLFFLDHIEADTFLNFSLQPRINPFQSQNQELPLINMGIRPFEFGSSGIISQNFVSASFLDYVYNEHIHKHIHNIHAIRLEANHRLYRPIYISHCTFTPYVGLVGIFYNNNQVHRSVGQAVFTYGGEANTRLSRRYESFKHIVEPYLNFQGLTRPLAGLNDHYVFNIDDGYFKVNLLRGGVRNSFYRKKDSSSILLPRFVNDTYTYAYFDDTTFSLLIPKVYTNFGWLLPNLAMHGGFAWNGQEQLCDFANIRADYTFSENFALGVEFRHRSRFDWRKADHENFILDFAHSPSQLVHTPISDGRDTLLTRIQARISPQLTCHFQSHHGWGRRNEPRYNAYKIDFFTMLTCSFQLRLSFQRTPNDRYQFDAGVNLIK